VKLLWKKSHIKCGEVLQVEINIKGKNEKCPVT